MKRRVLIGILKVIAVGGLVMIIAGCSPGGDSPKDIVNSFFNDINNERFGDLRSYLDEDATNYPPPENYWSDTQFPFGPYDVTLSGSGPVTADTVDTNGNAATYRFEFSGSEGNLFNDSDYKIKKITEDPDGSPTVIFQ